MPEIWIEEIESLYHEELEQEMPITYIALYDQIPVGSCTLQLNDGIRPDLEPWLGDLVVDPKIIAVSGGLLVLLVRQDSP